MLRRETVDPACFNSSALLPYSLRVEDFQIAMQDVYDFFFDVNAFLIGKDLPRLDDMVRKAAMSGLISEMLTASVAKHSRALVQNRYPNGHPDLLVRGEHANDSCKAGETGIEIKTTVKRGGAVDTHGARNQWFCVFVYEVDETTEPVRERRALRFTELYLAEVRIEDFRRNERGALGTRTATLHRDGIKKLRSHWLYRLDAA